MLTSRSKGVASEHDAAVQRYEEVGAGGEGQDEPQPAFWIVPDLQLLRLLQAHAV